MIIKCILRSALSRVQSSLLIWQPDCYLEPEKAQAEAGAKAGGGDRSRKVGHAIAILLVQRGAHT